MSFGSIALLSGALLIVPVASAHAQQESRRGRQSESPASRPEDTPRRAEPKEIERPQPERRADGQGRRDEPAVTRPRAEPEPARSTGDPELKRRKR